MTNLESNYTESSSVESTEEINDDGIETGPRVMSNMFSPEMLEDLDHRLEAEGYSINTIEDAFEFLDEDKADELEGFLQLFEAAANEEAVQHALDGIINIIK